MTVFKRELGIAGLGRMGANLATQALEKGIRIVCFDLKKAHENLESAGLVKIHGLEGLREKLTPPRAILMYIPAGPAIDHATDDILTHLDRGDILMDGGNFYWGDSICRYRRLSEKGINFIDLGTSGGVEGARQGACFTAGGDKNAIARIVPLPMSYAGTSYEIMP